MKPLNKLSAIINSLRSVGPAKKTLPVILVVTIILISGLFCSKELTLKHTVLDEDIVDTETKMEITLKVIVEGNITVGACRELLNRLFRIQRARTDFKYHKAPTNIYIYLYDSKETYEYSDQWLAMLSWLSSTSNPQIRINELLIASLGSDSDKKHGFSEKKRRKIFEEIVLAKDKATVEAEKKYPTLILYQRDTSGSQSLTMEEINTMLKKQSEYIRKHTQINLNKVMKKYKINNRVLTEIAIEGFKKKWPLPTPLDGL